MRQGISVSILFGGLLACAPASAQLVLPGAMPPSAQPVIAAPAGAGPAKKRGDGDPGAPVLAKAAILKPPAEDTVIGRRLMRNGAQGALMIDRAAGGLRISQLSLPGFQISRPADACRVDIGGADIALAPTDRHEGLVSYAADLEACPFSLDILDGATLTRGKTCDFVKADCRVDPAGFWGPASASFGPADAKSIERTRAVAETDARATFRVLLNSAKGNRARVKEIARDQAAFSSTREEICRDYAGEDKSGFCASRVTQAHAIALSAELHGPQSAEIAAKPVKKKRRPKPPAPAAAGDPTPPPL